MKLYYLICVINIASYFSIELKQNRYRAFHYIVSGYNARHIRKKSAVSR